MSQTIDGASAAASTLFLGRNGDWWDFWLIVSLIFVALAAIAAFVTTTGSIVSHKREAAGAEAALERFKLETEKKISEADARTVEAQLALEKLKSPRTLGVPKQNSVVAMIARFKGQRYRAAISQAADDGLAFWESLYGALQKAGWIYVPVAGPPSIGMPRAGIPVAAMPGIEIRFDPSKEREVAPAALALGNALNANKMVVAVNRDSLIQPNEEDRDILIVVIGARVPPP